MNEIKNNVPLKHNETKKFYFYVISVKLIMIILVKTKIALPEKTKTIVWMLLAAKWRNFSQAILKVFNKLFMYIINFPHKIAKCGNFCHTFLQYMIKGHYFKKHRLIPSAQDFRYLWRKILTCFEKKLFKYVQSNTFKTNLKGPPFVINVIASRYSCDSLQL